MEDGRCLLDVINDLESVLSELDPQPSWNSENNQNGDPSALDEFFHSQTNDQVAAAVASEDEELWSPTASAGGGVEGQDAGNVVVYQDPLAEAMASITAPSSSPSPPQRLSDLQAMSSGVLEHSSQISIDDVQYDAQQLNSSYSQLVVSSSATIPSQVLHYAGSQPQFQADSSIVSSASPARVLTPQPASRTESPFVRQVVTPTAINQQGQQIQLSQSQLNFLLQQQQQQQQQQQGTQQQTMTFVTQAQPVVSAAQGIQTQPNIVPIVNRQLGNVQGRPQGVVPGTTLQGALIQTSTGQRFLIQQPVMPGQQINLAQLQQQLQASGGGVIQLQSAGGQTIQLQGAAQPASAQVQNQIQPAIQLHQSGTSTPVAQSPGPVAQPLQIQQPGSGTSTPVPQQTYQFQQAIQQVQGSSTGQVAGKPQSNMSIINVNTPQGPQQILIQRANGPQNQNVILGALPPNVIQIQTSGVPQNPVLNSNGQTPIGQPHVLGNVNLVNSAQNVNINMVLPAGQNFQTLQAAQQALQLQGQQIVNIMNSQGQTVQVAKNVLGQNLKLNVGGQQVPISLQQLKQLQGMGLAQQQQQQPVIPSSVNTNLNSQITTSTSVAANTGINAAFANHSQIGLQQALQQQPSQQQPQHVGSQHHPIVIGGTSTPPSSLPASSANTATSLTSLPCSYVSQVSSVASVPQVVSSNSLTSQPVSSLSQHQPVGQVLYNVSQSMSSSSSLSVNSVPSQPSINSSVAQIPQTVPVQSTVVSSNPQATAASNSIPNFPLHQQGDNVIPINSALQSNIVAGNSRAPLTQSVLQAPPNVNIQNITKIPVSNTNFIPSTVQVVPKVLGVPGGNSVSQVVVASPTIVPQTSAQQLVGPKPVIVQNQPMYRLSPQNQEMMRQLQANIAKLQKLPNRTEKHESLLRQLKEVLQKLLHRAHLDAIQQQQQQQQAQQVVQVKTGQTYAVSNVQGQVKANLAQQNLTVVAPAQQTGVVQPVASAQTNAAIKALKTPVSATITLATATTNIPLLAPGQQLKTLKNGPMLQIISRHNHRQLQIPQALQEKLAKLTPEQQQLFLKTQGPLLVKLHQEQQARLQQQQQLQGKVPITVQPVGTQLKPLLATGVTVVQKPQPLTKATIISQQLQRDQKEATHPDFKTPFKNVKDACKRLIRYHVFQSSEPTAEDWENDTALYEEVAEGLLDRKQRMYDKFRSLLYAEAMRPQPLSEMAMLEKMFIQSEKELLENDKKLVKESPELFKPSPYIVKEEDEPVKVIKVKQEPTSEHEVSPQVSKRKGEVVISDSEDDGPSPEKLQKTDNKDNSYTARQGGGLKMVFKTSPKHPNVKQEPDLAANYDLKPFSIKLEPLPDYKAFSSNLLGSQVKLERGDLEKVLSSKNHEVMFTDDEEEEEEEEGKTSSSQNSLFAFSGGGGEEESNQSQSQDNSIAQEGDEESSETDAAASGLLDGSTWSGKHRSLPFRRSERDPLGLDVSQDSEFDSAVSNLEDSELGHLGMSRHTSNNVEEMFGSDDDNDGPGNNLKVEVESAINSILSLQGSELGIGEDQGLPDHVDGSHMDPYLASQESDSQDDLEAAVNSILY